MQTKLLSFCELLPSQLARWRHIQSSNKAVESPFFAPEFAGAVAASRDDVEVAVFSRGGVDIGFFPFHRCRFAAGRAVGFFMNDYQGVVAEPGVEVSAAELLRACRLNVWHFDHLICQQKQLGWLGSETGTSPYIDLNGDFDTYRRARRAAGSQAIEQGLRKERKLAREVGPVRFQFHTSNRDELEALIRWKGRQQNETRHREIFRHQWVRDLVSNIQQHKSPRFAGVLSSLYAGEQLMAVHLGMRTDTTLHWWIPTYNRSYQKYSPGLILLVKLAQATAEQGLLRIDLGKGQERYKQSMMTGNNDLLSGCAVPNPLSGVAWVLAEQTRRWVRQSPLRGPAQIPKWIFRQMGHWMAGR